MEAAFLHLLELQHQKNCRRCKMNVKPFACDLVSRS